MVIFMIFIRKVPCRLTVTRYESVEDDCGIRIDHDAFGACSFFIHHDCVAVEERTI